MRFTLVNRPRPGGGSGRPLPQGILLGIGSLAVIAAGFVASAVPPGHATLRYGVLAATVLVFTALADVWAAPAAVAMLGYLVFNGFLVNQLGELSWHGAADTTRLVALAAAVTAGRVIGHRYRARRLIGHRAARRPTTRGASVYSRAADRDA